jgi:hypothetical protein
MQHGHDDEEWVGLPIIDEKGAAFSMNSMLSGRFAKWKNTVN